MSLLGWILAVGGLAGVIFGIRMMLKGKKMTTVPFKKPSEIAAQGASAADEKGLVSTEGSVVVGENLVAPMSGQPCLAYKIEVERKWEKSVTTEKGTEKKTGKDRLHTEYKGSVFSLSDGAGAISVDVNKEPDVKFEKGHSETHSIGAVIPGTLQFGQLQFNVPSLSHDARTTHIVGTEYLLKPSPSMYALGQLQGTTIAEPKGALSGKLALSSQGREHLLKTTKRNMTLGFAIGGVLAVGGTALGVLGPAPAPGMASCKDFNDTIVCGGRMYDRDGIDYKWTVTKAGPYHLVVKMPPGLKYPVDPMIRVLDGSGKELATNTGPTVGADAVVDGTFEPGTYKVNVRDFARTTINGGYSFHLTVASPTAEVAAASPTAAANVGGGAAPAAAPSTGGGPGTCQKAIKCCKVITPTNAACDNFNMPGMTDASCQQALDGMLQAVKAMGRSCD